MTVSSGILIVMLVLIIVMLGLVLLLTVIEGSTETDEQVRRERRTRAAEREVGDISRDTQDAIVRELAWRSMNRGQVIDGEIVPDQGQVDGQRY